MQNTTSPLLESYKKVDKEKEDKIKKVIEEQSTIQQEDQDERESKHYSKFAEQESDAIKVMTGFTNTEFLELYGIVEKSLTITGRGKKAEICPIDAFFLTLVMLRHYEPWEVFALNHGIKKPVITTCIHKTLTRIKDPLRGLLPSMNKETQTKEGIILEDFPEVELLVDVNFQQRTKPKKSLMGQSYYNDRFLSYGFKVEVAHLPNGLAVFVGGVYVGSSDDFLIFNHNVDYYRTILKKNQMDPQVDNGELKDEYPELWALMVDKDYQGADELIRAILPKKGNDLSRDDQERNQKIEKNHVICEQFYGRMKKLFKIMELKFKWHKNHYCDVFNVCTALTNFHIMRYPLQDDDGIYHRAILNGYKEVTLEKKKKQKERNEKFTMKRKKKEQKRAKKKRIVYDE